MKSLYESVFSYLTSQIDKRIDALEDEKDAAVSSLESQRDAAEAAYKAQIEELESRKKANEEIIDGLQDEIDAIEDANDERQRALDLQQAQYNLAKMQNQRTILQYSENKGMHYDRDESEVRDAKESVQDAEDEIRIANLEKQIDYYEKLNDEIDDQIDHINDLIDASNAYYDKLIEDTESYFDALIKALEAQKDEISSLTDIAEEAEMKALLEELGINEEALLNGSADEFNKLKEAYLGIIKDMNAGNDGVLAALGEMTGYGEKMSGLTGYLDATADSFDGIGSSLQSVGENATAIDDVSNSLENVATNTTTAATGMTDLETATSGISENLTPVTENLETISSIDSNNILAIADAFKLLAEYIQSIADALGLSAETEGVGGLVAAFEKLNEITLGDGENGIVGQFEKLKSAVTAVASAIGGGVSGGTGEGGGNPDESKSASMSFGADDSGSGGGITSAITSLGDKAESIIGGTGSGDETVTGKFETLKTAIDDVSAAIGIGDDSGEGGGIGGIGGEGDESTLTGAITSLGETTEETLGESGGEGVIGRFEQFKDVIAEANEHVTGISTGLEAIDGTEVSCTIKVNIETTGSIGGGAAEAMGTVFSGMNLDSAQYDAKFGAAHAEGTAKLTGDWSVHQGGKALVGEVGQELIVDFAALYSNV